MFPLFHLSAPFVSVSADSTGSVCCFLFNSDLPLSQAAHSAMKSADTVTVKHAAVVFDFCMLLWTIHHTVQSIF